MPRFFFDLNTPDGFERDGEGLTFASVEMAYLGASQAAVDISIELLRERKDPSRYGFDVRDVGGQLVLELPFAEVLQPGRPAPPRQMTHAQERLRATLDRSRRLKAELVDVLDQARGAALQGLALSRVDWSVAGTFD